MGIALSGKAGKVVCFWRNSKTGDKAIPVEFSVKRDEKKKQTLYLVSIPWKRLGRKPEKGLVIGMNYIVFDDDDGKGTSYWNQLTAGLTGNKSPKRFKRFLESSMLSLDSHPPSI